MSRVSIDLNFFQWQTWSPSIKNGDISGKGYLSKSCDRLSLGLSGWLYYIHINSITKRLASELTFRNVEK